MNEERWAQWRLAAHALGQGRTELAVKELERLHGEQDPSDPLLLCNITYTLGVALCIADQPARAILLFQRLRKTKGFGSPLYSPVSTLVELAASYSKLRQFQAALEIADEAVKLAGGNPALSAMPYFQRAIAKRGLCLIDEAIDDFTVSLRGEIKGRQIVRAGISVEWLARLYLERGNTSESLAWEKRMRFIYEYYSPQHLVTARDVIEFADRMGPFCSGDGDSEILGEDGASLDVFISELAAAHPSNTLNVLDIDLFRFLQGTKAAQESPLHIVLPIHTPTHPFPRLGDLILSDIRTIQAHSLYPRTIETSWLYKRFFANNHDCPVIPQMLASEIRFDRHDGKLFLYWESFGPWPWAFAATLLSLSNLFRVGFLYGKAKAKEHDEAGIENTIDYFSKTLPWATQGRYLGEGQVASGLVKIPPHFIEDIARESIFSSATNRSRFTRMGYTDGESKQLDDGGLAAVLFSDVQGTLQSLGGHPVNEINLANLPSTINPWDKKENHRWGIFIDRNYQTPFLALRPDDYALYGRSNELFRDHFDPFREGLKIVGSVRSKHYAIPIIEASNVDELQAIVAKLRTNPRVRDNVFFRGQTSAYSLSRTDSVKRILFGRTDVIEPSLLGASPRRGLDYNHVHSPFQVMVQDFMYQEAAKVNKPLEHLHQKWNQFICDNPAKWEIGVMALAQHYGIPTHGLDITSSIEVALWFATNKYKRDSSTGKVQYVTLPNDSWSVDPQKWPVIYLIQPVTYSIRPSIHSIQSLESLGVTALRPIRQHAHFFMGADTLHQNRLAEALACLVRLRPGSWESSLKYEFLIPRPTEDPAYDFMLKVKEAEGSGPLAGFFGEIAEYEY